MPLYVFECTVCGNKEEKLTSMSLSHIDTLDCPKCGEEAKRIPSGGGFELKGGGWAGSGYSKGD
jgi:putative FmdB family regulatory protein